MDDWMQKVDSRLERGETLEPLSQSTTPATSQRPESPADEWMDRVSNRLEQPSAVIIDFKKSPDQAASDQKMAKSLGINTSDVEFNRENVTAEYKKRQVHKTAEASPTLRRLMSIPEWASATADDYENLINLEKTLTTKESVEKYRDEMRQTFTRGTPGPVVTGQQKNMLQEQTKAFDEEDPWYSHIFHAARNISTGMSRQIAGTASAAQAERLASLRRIDALQTSDTVRAAWEKYLKTKNEEDNPFAKRDDRGALVPIDDADTHKTMMGILEISRKKASSDYIKSQIRELESGVRINRGTAAQIGEQIRKDAPYTQPGSWREEFGEIAQSAGQMFAPALLSALTRRPVTSAAVGAGSFAPGIFGDSYTEMYDRIQSEYANRPDLTKEQLDAVAHEKAMDSAGMNVLVETGTNLLTFGYLKSNAAFWKKLTAETQIEGFGEGLGAGITYLYDEGLVDDRTTLVDDRTTLDVVLKDDLLREQFLTAMRKGYTGGVVIAGGMTTALEPIHRIGAASTKKADDLASAEAVKQQLVDIGEAVKATKTHARSPEHLSEFVNEAVKEGVSDIYIDIDEFVGYWQTAKEGEIESIVDAIPGVNEQIEEAMISGGDIKIPLSEYATKIAPTEHNAAFSEISRFRQADQSRATAAEEAAQKSPEQEAVQEKERSKFAESAEKVSSSIAEQLIATGKYNFEDANKSAVLHSAFSKMMARELGVPPHEAYEKYQIKIQAAKVSGKSAEGLNQPSVYESASKTVSKAELNKGTAKQWKELLGAAPKETHKWLDTNKGEVSKQDVLDNISENITREQLLFQENRGVISFGKGIGEDVALITLLEKADLTTFLHESSHYFFEVMKDLSLRPDASPQIKKDMEALVKFAGVESLEKWSQMGLEARRNGHEKVADAFEDYLMEGKAPSAELKGVFQRFRDWLTDVYKSVKRQAQLTDDVRDVFDRMLASQESINAAKRSRQYQAMFDSAEQAGWTEEAWARYTDNLQKMAADAGDILQTRLIRDMKWLSGAKNRKIAALQKEAEEKRKPIREEVIKEIEESPKYQIYQIMDFLKRGDKEQGIPAPKLSIPNLEQMYPDSPPPTDWKKLGYGKNGMLAEDGVGPQAVATRYGISSGDALMQAIFNATPKEQLIQEETDRRMLEKYGDITSQKAIEEAANEALHNAVREKVLEAQYAAIAKVTGAQRPTSKAVKARAEAVISQKKVRDIKPSFFRRNEESAGKKAQKAMLDGDIDKAGSAALSLMISNKLYKASVDAEKEIARKIAYLSKFENEGTRKAIADEHLEQIDAIIVKFDLRKNVPLRVIDERKSLAEWINNREANGLEPAIDHVLAEQIKKKHYKDMTLEELRTIVDDVVQIEHLGREEERFLVAMDKANFKESMEKAKQFIIDNKNRTVAEVAAATDTIGSLAEGAKSYLSGNRRIGSIIREMSGMKDGGLLFDIFIRPGIHSSTRERALNVGANEYIGKLLDELGGIKEKRDKRFLFLRAVPELVPGTDISMTHEARIVFAAYYGSKQGKQRLHDNGVAGKDGLTDKEAAAILDTLKKEDWDAVKKMWALGEQFRPDIAAQEKSIYGKEPKWIDPLPIVTKHGVMPGGYIHLFYDAMLSSNLYEHEAAINTRSQMVNFNSANTSNSYTKERSEKVKGKKLLLNLSVLARQVSEVTHRLAWQDYVIDVRRSFNALEKTMREHYGPEITNEIKMHIERIALGQKIETSAVAKSVGWIASGTTIASLAWNFTVSAIQLTGVLQGWMRVGPAALAKGVMEMTGNHVKAFDKVRKMSPAMARRWESGSIREMANTIEKSRALGKVNLVDEFGFYFTSFMQQWADTPIFFGAYEKFTEQLKLENAANEAERLKIESEAADLAYQAVIDSQGSGLPHEMARVMQEGKIQTLFTLFLNFPLTVYNQNVEAYRGKDFKKISSYPKYMVDLLMINAMPTVALVALRNLLKTDCEWDDNECLIERYKNEQIGNLMGMFAYFREAHAAVEILTSDDSHFGYSGPAGLRVFKDIYNMSRQIKQGDADLPATKAFISVLGPILHLPSAQINKMISGAVAVMDDDVEGVSAVKAIPFGPPREK